MLPAFDPLRYPPVATDVFAATRAGDRSLTRRRERRLGDLLTAAAQGSALYRRILQGRDPRSVSLPSLPVMHKAELMGRFEDWVTDSALRLDALRRFTADRSRIADAYLGRYIVWESSGSTGEPALFVQDAAAMAVYDALEALRRPAAPYLQRLFDPWRFAERLVFVGAIGGHFASTVSIERLRRLNPLLASQLHSVSFLQPTARLAAEIDALAPTVLSTNPTMAVLLGQEHLDGRMAASPREVWTGGETLSTAMRAFVRRAFDCVVINSYGASEFLALACECSHGGMHLNSDWAILEPVDAHGRAVPTGEFGATTLLTNLANHVQPLIRYDIGDRVRLLESPCECGSNLPVIEVDGRADDTLSIGEAPARPVSVLSLALCTVLEEEAGLFDFQLVQEGPCQLLLRTGLRGKEAHRTLQRAHAALTAFLARQGASPVRIRCRSGEPGRRGRSGKVRRVMAG